MSDLAKVYQAQAKWTAAEPLLTQALDLRRRAQGDEHPETAAAFASLGELRLAQQRSADAEPLLRSALAAYDRSAPESWPRFKTQWRLGEALLARNQFAGAEPLLLSGYDGLTRLAATVPAADRISPAEAAAPILLLYERWQKPDRAAEWKQKAGPPLNADARPTALAPSRTRAPECHPESVLTWSHERC
jgi:eukaryotic-like serine/threonine-protein kinase